jgi:hypothetical protein
VVHESRRVAELLSSLPADVKVESLVKQAMATVATLSAVLPLRSRGEESKND